MSDVKLIKKYFDFLKKYGFKRKVFTTNGDCQVAYSNKRIIIEISCYLGVNNIPLSSGTPKLTNDFSYVVSVSVKYDYQGGNILYCELFDKQKRMKLKTEIEDEKINNIEFYLKKYSQFIMDNVEVLLR